MNSDGTTQHSTLQERGLALLRSVSQYGQPLENHCIRLAEFSIALAKNNDIDLNEDLTRCVCFLHDIGLCVDDIAEKNYLKRGLNFVRPKVVEWGIQGEDLTLFEDIFLFNHSIRKVPGLDQRAEMVRLAVSVEHSFGVFSHGLDRTTRRETFSRYPRTGFNRVLMSFFKKSLVDDGPTQLFGIFLPRPQ